MDTAGRDAWQKESDSELMSTPPGRLQTVFDRPEFHDTTHLSKNASKFWNLESPVNCAGRISIRPGKGFILRGSCRLNRRLGTGPLKQECQERVNRRAA